MARLRRLLLILLQAIVCVGNVWPHELLRRDNSFNSTGWHELGCYNDSGADRTLSQIGYVLGGPDNMTVENCQAGCKSAGYDIAGVEYSYQCFCDNKIRNYGASASDGYHQCTMACNGNATQSCGGPNRLNLYTFVNISATAAPTSSQAPASSAPITAPPSTSVQTTTAAATTTSTMAVVSGTSPWVSMGCYNDSLSDRTLSYIGYVLGGPGNMTVENCETACYEAGYVIAGLEYSGQCFCDDEFRHYGGPASDGNAQCTMTCNGDPTQTCGGPNRLNIYSYMPSSTFAPSSSPSSALPSPSATITTTTSQVATHASSSVSVAPSATANGWVDLGCYNDSGADRTLSYVGYVLGGPGNMTVENCQAGCLSQGFILAGVEYSGQCFCDNKLENNGGPAQDGNAQCTMTCNGNPKQTCGGPNRLNMYSFVTATPTSTAASSGVASSSAGVTNTSTGATGATSTMGPPITPSSSISIPSTTSQSASQSTSVPTSIPSGWSYAGCYKDNVNARRVMGNEQNDNPNMTLESCIGICAGLNYTIAGMEYSTQCFCDNILRDNTTLSGSDSDCAMTCGGDPSEICGGPNLLSVYSKGDVTILPIPAPQKSDLPGMWKYQGCLQDNVDGVRTFPYEIIYEDNNTPATCLSRCSDYGFGAAGLEYGSQCFCGDVRDIGPDVKMVPDSQCSQECSGDPTAICGDGNLMSYYTWDGPALQNWSYPTGNDAGRYEFLIGGVVVPLMTTLNINGKITFVEKWGTGPPNSTGAYEFDPVYENDFDNAWRALHVKTDVFCGVGLVLPDKVGRQIVLGGWSGESTEAIRLYWPDGSPGHASTNDFQENVNELALQEGRWYPSAMIMANGSILVVGGEEGSNAPPVPTIEILPKVGPTLYMDWLNRTDPNNLYPFVTVLPSGGIFVVYYNEARILDENTFETVRTLPNLPGSVNNDLGGRTYPLEGTMVTLPQYAPYKEPLEALVCGGSANFVGPVIDNCLLIQPEVPGANWTLERMPSKRVMTCMAPLPDGTFLIVNGAKEGVAGFGLASDPNFNAVLYDPSKPVNSRMSVMANTTIARLYHSEALLMQDGRVLISGSDPQSPFFPEEYRVEVFIPPYLLSGAPRPTFTIEETDWVYGNTYEVEITSGNIANLKMSLIGMVSTTHGNSYGARTLFPEFTCSGSTCTITAPPDAHTCPPGWFHLFVLDGPTPSISAFVRIGGDPAELGNWPMLSDFTVPGV